MEKCMLMPIAGIVGGALCCLPVARGLTPGAAQEGAACQELKPQPMTGRPISRGQPAPDFELTDMTGKSWSLQELRGRPVVVNFWATWCEPCREEIPALDELARRSKGRLTVLAVNVDEDLGAVKKFFPEGTSLPVLLDSRKQVARRFGTDNFPETVLIDSSGRVQQLFHRAQWDGPAADACLAGLR